MKRETKWQQMKNKKTHYVLLYNWFIVFIFHGRDRTWKMVSEHESKWKG